MWEAYRDAERHMDSLAQKKMQAINVCFLRDVKTAGKDAANKFAGLQDPHTAGARSEDECLQLVEKFSAKFQCLETAMESPDPNTTEPM